MEFCLKNFWHALNICENFLLFHEMQQGEMLIFVFGGYLEGKNKDVVEIDVKFVLQQSINFLSIGDLASFMHSFHFCQKKFTDLVLHFFSLLRYLNSESNLMRYS